MYYIYALILGLVQGVTEFLPISSSGHLLLLPRIFNFADQGLAVDAVLHLATALAIVLYFRNEWWRMLRNWRKSMALRKIAIGSIPAALVGVVFGDLIESIFRSPWVVVVTLITVGILMWLVERNYTEVKVLETAKKNEIVSVDWPEAILMGLVQPIALIPGVSRSGITLITGMWRNVNRVSAAKFTFLLSVPASLGAGLVKMGDLFTASNTDWLFVGIAGLTTFVVAFFSIHWLLKYLQTNTLKPFVIYRIALALIVAVILLV